jgi:DNA polymerase-3 subunit delta'
VPDTLAQLRGPEGPAVEEPSDEPELDEPRETAKRISREIRIEQVRELSDFVGISTHRGGVRVIVLAPAEKLNQASANALLKMLEEPPHATRFVLVSDSIDDVLPTIRSRCVLQRVVGPDRSTALGWLREQGVEDPEARLAAAGGAPLAALDESEARLDEPVGSGLMALLAQGAALLPADVVARVPRNVPLGAAITLFQRWGWDLLAFRLAERVRYHPPQLASIKRIAGAAATDRLLVWVQSLWTLRATSDHPLNARLVVEAALLSYIEALQDSSART